MVAWVNRAVFQAPRNGTTSHTIDPSSTVGLVAGAAFTPTSGRLLVVVVEGAVTSSTPSGWTLPSGGSAIYESGLYVWYRTAAGGDTFATTHNASNYPVIFAVYEFPAGSTFVKSASGTGVSNTGANPNLTGLSGTNVVFGAKGTVMTSGWTYGGAVWSSGYVKDYDDYVPYSGTDGYWLTVAAQEGVTASSAQPTATISGTAFGAEALTFAVNVTSGGESNPGTLNAPLPKLTSDINGTSVNSGSLNALLPKLKSSIGGSSKNGGVLATKLPKLKTTIAGQSINLGVLSASLPLLTTLIADTQVNNGVMSATLPQLTSVLSGNSVNPGSLALTTPKVTALINGISINNGVLAIPLPSILSGISGISRNPGTLTSSIPLLAVLINGANNNTLAYLGDVLIELRLGDYPVVLRRGDG